MVISKKRIQLKFVTIQVVQPQVTQIKMQARLAKLLTKTEEVPFQRSPVQPLIWNMPVNFKVGLELATELWDLCDSAAHR